MCGLCSVARARDRNHIGFSPSSKSRSALWSSIAAPMRNPGRLLRITPRLLYIAVAATVASAVVIGVLFISRAADAPTTSGGSEATSAATPSSPPKPSETVETTASAATSPTIRDGELSLSDFDQIQGKWKEDSYDVEGTSVHGFGTLLRECGTAELGLTLLLPSMKLTAEIGEDLAHSSPPIYGLKTLRVYRDGRLIHKKTFRFAETVSVSTKDYGNIRLRFTNGTKGCIKRGKPAAFVVLAQPTLMKE